jgi:hypothetical protein
MMLTGLNFRKTTVLWVNNLNEVIGVFWDFDYDCLYAFDVNLLLEDNRASCVQDLRSFFKQYQPLSLYDRVRTTKAVNNMFDINYVLKEVLQEGRNDLVY